MGARFKFVGGGCCCCPDVALLTDTTGSMGGFIASIQSIFNSLSQALQAKVCEWCVAEYKDLVDGVPFSTLGINVNRQFTAAFSLVTTAINGWSASGGGDEPEEQFLALKYLADHW